MLELARTRSLLKTASATSRTPVTALEWASLTLLLDWGLRRVTLDAPVVGIHVEFLLEISILGLEKTSTSEDVKLRGDTLKYEERPPVFWGGVFSGVKKGEG
jgi:hypothetical protein